MCHERETIINRTNRKIPSKNNEKAIIIIPKLNNILKELKWNFYLPYKQNL